MRATALSPHLDDAVFSAWRALAGARVLTVCAGLPPEGRVTDLDRSHGASDSSLWMRRRRSEDGAALDLAGAKAVHLDALDIQYRAPEGDEAWADLASRTELRLGVDALAAVTAGRLPADGPVFAPLGVGGHPDHVDVARYAVDLARRGRAVTLWADSPYFLRYGPPGTVTGHPNPAADRLIDDAFAAVGLRPDAARIEVAVLADDEVARKLAALRRYETELASIVADFGPFVTDPATMRYELYWQLARG